MIWNERYAHPEYIFGIQPNDFLVSAAHHIPHGKVLCLGEGEGRNAVYLASLGYQVTAVDQSAMGLAKAQKLAAQQNVQIETVVADLAEFVIQPRSWQGIISIFCHLPSALWLQVFTQAAAGLVVGGVLLLEAYTPRQLEFETGGPKSIDMLLPLERIQQLQGLQWQIAHETERLVVEGTSHTGHAAVVQIVARAI